MSLQVRKTYREIAYYIVMSFEKMAFFSIYYVKKYFESAANLGCSMSFVQNESQEMIVDGF